MTVRPSFFWCTHHRLVHRFENYAFADGQIHRVHARDCTMIGPFFTHEEAVERGVLASGAS